MKSKCMLATVGIVAIHATVLAMPRPALTPWSIQGEDALEAEKRIIQYVQDNMKSGEPLIVSKLYNEVFTTPVERSVLDKLNGAFFRIPLFILQFQESSQKLPTLQEISDQFDFYGPEEASVVLSIMEADPRVPKFIVRDSSGELTEVDIEKVKADARFNKIVERTLTGWEGRILPEIAGMSFDGNEVSLAQRAGSPVLVYVWFTNCPPCVKIGPELVALQKEYGSRGFTVFGLNADKVLKLKYTDADRNAYAEKVGTNYPNIFLTQEVREALGSVNIFPTLFLLNGERQVVKHFVNFQSRDVLGPEIDELLDAGSDR